MSRSTKLLSMLCLLIGIGLVGVASTTAQFDTCFDPTNEIKYNDEVVGTLSAGLPKIGDGEGIYCFEGKKGDFVLITAEVTRGDFSLVLLLSSFSVPGLSERSFSLDKTTRLSYVLPEDTAYTIIVARGNYDAGAYTLSIVNQNERRRATATPGPTVTPRPTPTAVPTLTAAQAVLSCTPGAYILIPGYTSEFFINPQSTTQTYCLYGRAGTRYGITVEGVQGTLDPMVIVYSSDFESILASNNNVAEGQTQAHTEFRASESTFYSIVIARAGFNTGISEGIYRVTAENLTTDTLETCPPAFQIPDTGLSIEAMSQDGLHAFCVNGQVGQEIRLTAEAQSGNLAMTVYIIEPNWDTVGDATSAQETLEITASLEKDQPYFILVFDDSAAGGFDLTLTQK